VSKRVASSQLGSSVKSWCIVLLISSWVWVRLRIGFIDGRVDFIERTDFITDFIEDLVFCFVNSKDFSVRNVGSLTNVGGVL